MFLTSKDEFDFRPVWDGEVQLQGDIRYLDDTCGLIEVPDGFICDLASYFLISKVIFSKLGKSMRAAFVHDYLYRHQPEGVSRTHADRIFYEALLEDGMSKVAARTHWLGVRAGGWLSWWKAGRKLKR